MAEEFKITIIKDKDTGVSEKAKQTAVSSNVEDTEDSSIESESYSSKIVVAQMGAKAVSSSVAILSNEVQWRANRRFALNDDYIGQRNRDIASSLISTITSDVGQVLNWTMMGAKAGPYGAIAGMAIGTIVTGIKRAQAVSHALEDQQLHIDQMDAQLSFNRQRAGFSLSAGSIGENL